MKHGCPNQSCHFYQKRTMLIKKGGYWRRSDSKRIQRFQCTSCKRNFSSASFAPTYKQHKRRVNSSVFKLYCSGVSQRRIAQILGINLKTVARKVRYLGARERVKQKKYRESLRTIDNLVVHFDDLITIEHTKLKPLSVTIAVEESTRKILAVRVSKIGAFGLLVDQSLQKYGKRPNEHRKNLDSLFQELQKTLTPTTCFKSDEHQFYAPVVKKYFAGVNHTQFKGGRGCIVGQGELKKLRFDPLFSLNHTCAMLRANINRLIRKTWCTTKKIDCLRDHLDMYVSYHNQFLTPRLVGT